MNHKFERLLSKNSQLLTHGHDFVEIGGLRWATCNVGAEKPTDTGLYFQWGDTQGYAAEEILNGTFENNSQIAIKTPQDPVRANWGGAWRLPTANDFISLTKATYAHWTDNYEGSGVTGMILTNKKNHKDKLFFPALGWGCLNTTIHNMRNGGRYWVMSNPRSIHEYVGNMHFYCYGKGIWFTCIQRQFACQIRGVIG